MVETRGDKDERRTGVARPRSVLDARQTRDTVRSKPDCFKSSQMGRISSGGRTNGGSSESSMIGVVRRVDWSG